MKRIIAEIMALVALCAMMQACADDSNVESYKLGTVSYHPAFLWTDAELVPLEKTMVLDFSDDAKVSQKEVFAEFQWVDNDGKPLNLKEFIIAVDGQQLKNNSVRVTARDTQKKLTISVDPKIKTGKYQGYLKLKNSNLDRLGNDEVKGSKHPYAFQWTLYYETHMNPLAQTLMWIGIVIVALLMLWFAIVRPTVFPHFASYRKTINVTQNGKVVIGGKNINCTDVWKYVFANQKVKQSLLERIFCGKIVTMVDPVFVDKLTLRPDRKNGRASGRGYIVNRNPILKVGAAQITHAASGLQIDIR